MLKLKIPFEEGIFYIFNAKAEANFNGINHIKVVGFSL